MIVHKCSNERPSSTLGTPSGERLVGMSTPVPSRLGDAPVQWPWWVGRWNWYNAKNHFFSVPNASRAGVPDNSLLSSDPVLRIFMRQVCDFWYWAP